MKFKLEFAMDNAAFQDSYDENDNDAAMRGEIKWVLGELARNVEVGGDSGSIRDSSGNRIGKWEIVE